LDLEKTKKAEAGASITKKLLATELVSRGERVTFDKNGDPKEKKNTLLDRLKVFAVGGKIERLGDIDGETKSRSWKGAPNIRMIPSLAPQEEEKEEEEEPAPTSVLPTADHDAEDFSLTAVFDPMEASQTPEPVTDDEESPPLIYGKRPPPTEEPSPAKSLHPRSSTRPRLQSSTTTSASAAAAAAAAAAATAAATTTRAATRTSASAAAATTAATTTTRAATTTTASAAVAATTSVGAPHDNNDIMRLKTAAL
jgi:hypothetical protein